MKKNILLSFGLLLFGSLWAQNQTNYDALKLTSSEVHGTARFMSLGGSMGAVGGDASTLFYNPAGLGVYRSSEMTFTGNAQWNNTNFGGNTSTNTRLSLDNGSYIVTWDTQRKKGLRFLNFGFSYNRKKSFFRKGYYSGNKDYSITEFLAAYSGGIDSDDFGRRPYANNEIGWNSIMSWDAYLMDPTLIGDNYTSYYDKIGNGDVADNISFTERGFNNEFAFSIGGNFNDIVYWGMSFICDYTEYSNNTSYEEIFSDNSSLLKSNSYSMNATGFTYKLGVILKPLDWLRIGAAFHTPTWYKMYDWADASITYNIKDTPAGTESGKVYPPQSSHGSALVSGPLQAMASLGFIINEYGFINIDYQYANNRDIRLEDVYGKDLIEMNNQIHSTTKDTHTLRIGIEAKPTEELSIRLGGGYTSPSMYDDAMRIYYANDVRTDTDFYNDKGSYHISGGIGYRFGRHSIDLGYVYQTYMSDYYEFSPEYSNNNTGEITDINFDPVALNSILNQVVFSYNVRF